MRNLDRGLYRHSALTWCLQPFYRQPAQPSLLDHTYCSPLTAYITSLILGVFDKSLRWKYCCWECRGVVNKGAGAHSGVVEEHNEVVGECNERIGGGD